MRPLGSQVQTNCDDAQTRLSNNMQAAKRQNNAEGPIFREGAKTAKVAKVANNFFWPSGEMRPLLSIRQAICVGSLSGDNHTGCRPRGFAQKVICGKSHLWEASPTPITFTTTSPLWLANVASGSETPSHRFFCAKPGRGAAFPRGAWEQGLSFQRTIVSQVRKSLNYRSLAGRAAIFCREVFRFFHGCFGGVLLVEERSRKGAETQRREQFMFVVYGRRNRKRRSTANPPDIHLPSSWK
jgi:hypothetical protein